MMGRIWFRLWVLLSAVMICLPQTSLCNELINGSFETGANPPTGGYRNLAAVNADIDGWMVSSGNIDWINTYWVASVGSLSIDLSGTSAGEISQSFATTAGQDYILTFDMAGNPVTYTGVTELRVSAAGQSAVFSFDNTGRSTTNMGWETRTWVFQATTGTTTLSFLSLGDYNRSGPTIDDVVVDPYTVSGIPASERQALIALYNSTDGDNWTDNTGWKTPPLHTDGFALPGTENQWHGIYTGSNNLTVLQINLDNNNLTGTLPDVLSDLTNLQVLRLTSNQLYGNIPSALGALSGLIRLDLKVNNLTGTIPAELGELSSLIYLELGLNQISGTIPPGLGSLTKLVRLNLFSNELTGPIPVELGNLSELRYLELYLNQLDGPIPVEIGNLSNLENLDVSANDLTGSIPSEIGGLGQLVNLALSNNQFAGPLPPTLGNLSNLRSLPIFNNNFTGSIPPELGNLSGLVYLRLENNLLTGTLPASLGNLTELKHLYLAGNDLSGPLPPTLGNLVNLEILFLSNNRIDGVIPDALGNCVNLSGIFLDGNRFSGSIPTSLANLAMLVSLNISNNLISGSIPTFIGNFPDLVSLNVRSNMLSGPVPANLSGLSKLNLLDIGYNALYTTDAPLNVFLDGLDPDWESTQTIAPVFNVTDTTNTTLTFDWTPIPYTADSGGYDLYYGTAPGIRTYAGTTADKSASGYTITGLNPGTVYYVSIRTHTDPHANNQNTVNSDFLEILTGGTTSDQPNIEISPLVLTFGDVLVGDAAGPQSIIISNTGSAALDVSTMTLGDPANYSLDANGCGSTTPALAPGSQCSVAVTFSPATAGTHDTGLTIGSNDPDTPFAEVLISGAGVVDNPPAFVNAFLPTSVNMPTRVYFSGSVEDDIALASIRMSVGGPAGSHNVLSQSITGTSQSLSGYYFDSADPVYANQTGDYTVTLTVTDSNGQATPMDFPIRVVDTSAPDISLIPASADFAQIRLGSSSPPLTVTISNTGNLTLTVSGMTLSDPTNYSLNSTGCGGTAPAIAPGANCTVAVTFNPSTVALHSASLSIQSDDPDTPAAMVQLTGTGVPDNPPYFEGASLPNGAFLPQSIYFTGLARDDAGLTRISMTVNGPAGQHLIFDQSISGTAHDLTAYYFNSGDPAYAGTNGIYTVTLAIDDTAGQTTVRDFTVDVGDEPSPDIAVDPAAHDYGSALLADTREVLTLTLSNNGSADLAVSDLSLTDTGNFQIRVGTCASLTPVIAKGGNCTLEVVYVPQSHGVHGATLSISSNDPDRPLMDVQLTGVADDFRNDCQASSAATIALGSRTNGDMETAQDADYFTINLEAAGRLIVYTSHAGDTAGMLVDSACRLIAENDQPDLQDPHRDGFNFRIEADLAPGTYHIGVRPGTWYGDYTQTTYRLHVAFESERLVKTRWDQYRIQLDANNDGTDETYVLGCVPIAIAQLINYYFKNGHQDGWLDTILEKVDVYPRFVPAGHQGAPIMEHFPHAGCRTLDGYDDVTPVPSYDSTDHAPFAVNANSQDSCNVSPSDSLITFLWSVAIGSDAEFDEDVGVTGVGSYGPGPEPYGFDLAEHDKKIASILKDRFRFDENISISGPLSSLGQENAYLRESIENGHPVLIYLINNSVQPSTGHVAILDQYQQRSDGGIAYRINMGWGGDSFQDGSASQIWYGDDAAVDPPGSKVYDTFYIYKSTVPKSNDIDSTGSSGGSSGGGGGGGGCFIDSMRLKEK